ncbi:Bromodomain-containing protein [Whalleya microplaca]|nr:Bromodomain-containing protein [Whalleya microplaca]
MATEEPQSLPQEQKIASPTSADEIAVDKLGTQMVNGHTKSDEDDTKSNDAPTLNGKAKPAEATTESAQDAQNKQAFAANNDLPEQTPSKSNPEPSPAADTEMTDVNGNSDKTSAADTNPPPVVDTDKAESAEGPTSEKVSPTEPTSTAQDSATNGVVSDGIDSMEVDVSTERPDLMSSAEHGNSTQDTSAISDAPVVSSPQDLSQPSADLSKLDIKSKQQDTGPSQEDVPMADTPLSPAKVSRGREEDNGEERASKRAKTEESNEQVADSLVVASGLSPAPVPTGEPLDDGPNDQVITPYQNKQIRAALASIKKTKNGGNFRQSVERLWPGLWNDYKLKVPNPVDISLFESKLRENKYADYAAFKADVRLLYENSLTFNGPQNVITIAAGMVRDTIYSRLPEISNMEEPARPEKGKAQPTRHVESRGATQPRRQSQPQGRASSPKQKPSQSANSGPPTPASASAPAFAIPPNGIPQIRRDSTREDNDRPKRPIHPPKSRDPDYGSKANRKKKLEPEQRFFELVLEEIKKGKYFALNQWFLSAVDPVALNIPTYFSVVKKPMDLATMTQKNYEGEYKTSKDIEKDMKLIAHNAELFNGPDHEVTKLAKQLEDLFKAEMAKKEQWMERHYPPEAPSVAHASAPSPERSTHESDEESEADADEEDGSEAIRNLQGRLNEEQDKLNTLLGSKKPDLTMIEIQQSMVSMLQRKLVEEKTKSHGEEKKPKAKKKAAKSKPKAGASGGGASANSKKASTGNASNTKKTPSSNSKKAAPKARPVGSLEKAVIAEGINDLDGNTLTKAVEIIKRDTGQNENDDGEMELDIDALSMDALRRLYDLIHRANSSIRAALEKKPEFSSQAAAEPEPKPKPAAPPKAKKNKPMNKHEQERKIEQLRELKAQLQRHGSGSQEPLPSGDAEDNRPAESSEEESDSEEE